MKPAPDSILANTFKPTPYWWEDAPPETHVAPLPAETDVVIVGSGYCGLSAAAELARAGRQVTVLDKGYIGEGGSTRSGGMVSSGQKLVVTGAVDGLSAEQVSRLLAESLQTFEYLRQLIDENSLDADLQLYGRFFGAYTPSHFERLRQQGQLLREKTGVTVHDIPRAQQRSIIGSDYYYGGIVVDNYGGLHVGKYHRSLRELARSRGAELMSHAGVTEIQRLGNGGFRVQTERGAITARNVIIATNGYTGKESPYLHRRIIPVASYQIATAPLPAGMMQELNPGRRMISDSKHNLFYIRPSPDGTRILLGSRPVAFDAPETLAAGKLYTRLLRVFPQLSGIPVTHSWKGFVAITFDKRAHIGEHDGIHYAVGCNGNGVALMTYLGHKIARQLLDGQVKSPSAFSEGDFPSAFYYHGKPWVVPFGTLGYNALDTWEGRSRR